MTQLVVRPVEAAAMLGVSRRHFDREIKPQLKLIYSGRLVLVPVSEIEAWVKAQAKGLPR